MELLREEGDVGAEQCPAHKEWRGKREREVKLQSLISQHLLTQKLVFLKAQRPYPTRANSQVHLQ